MNDFAHPGVYIREVPSGPGPITGVSTSNLGLIGFSTKGPINDPIISTSYLEWSQKFGSFTDKGLSAHMAYAFFANGGQQMYFVRVVGDDSASADWDLVQSVTSETVSIVTQPTGIYDLQLDNSPVSAATLRVTFQNVGTPANVNVFDADAAGVLTLNTTLSGGSAAGGSGSVDMDTGEVHVELTDPSQYGGGSDLIVANYSYVIFGFKMAWPGLAGNDFRVRIVPGSDDYLVQAEARWTRFTVIVDEDVNHDSTNRSWAIAEEWADLVFDDAADASYIATVINADGSGSNLIEITDYGNGANPTALAGTQVSSESVSATQRPQGSSTTPPVAYDGATKAWEYTLANDPFKLSIGMSFQFTDGLMASKGNPTTIDATGAVLTDAGATWTVDALIGMVAVNLTDGSSGIITDNDATTVTAQLQGGTTAAWALTDDYAIIDPTVKIGTGTGVTGAGTETVVSPGSASVPAAIVPGSVSIEVTMTAAGVEQIVDDGAGNLVGDPDGTPVTVATINYTTGQITSVTGTVANQINFALAWAADTVVSGSSILFGCVYAQPVAVEDDADGNMLMSSTQATGYPSKFSLDSNGTNTITYSTGVVNLAWAISGNPAAGPSGAYVQEADYYTEPSDEISNVLTGGLDGDALTSADVVDPSLSVDEEGLYAFGKVNALMQLVAADFQTDTTVSDALVTYAELVKDKFVILTVPHGLSYQEAVNWKKFQLNTFTSYAALYYPHVKVLDPVTNVNLDIPVGGHIAGVYARTDTTRNVGEAPAGMKKGVIRWSTGLEADLSDTQVGIVYKEKINALVQWPHTGRVVWGARTLDAAGGEWPYIQMRRLFMYVEKSVFNATHTHVFDDNGPALWSAIQGQVSSFLQGLYDSGYLAGTSPAKAYFVICDRTNNPQYSVNQGIVYTDVGIATNKPAEFLVFRFSQRALSA